MSGIVGDTKLQFTVISQNVDRAQEICFKSQPNSIIISKKTYNLIVSKVNNILYEEAQIEIEGQNKQAFYVKKQRSKNRRLVSKMTLVARKSKTPNNPREGHLNQLLKESQKLQINRQNQDELEGSEDDRNSTDSNNSAHKASITRSEQLFDANDSFNRDNSFDGSLNDVQLV